MDAGTSAAPLVDERPCRSCGSPLRDQVVDLGLSPLCQTVIPPGDADRGEVFYPLTAMVCRECWLVQVGDVVSPEVLFQRDYPYFSSYSTSWLAHAERYVDEMVRRLGLDGSSQVVEVGSNDGYLLQFVVQRGIPALGIDPADGVAAAAVARGVPTRVAFFTAALAEELVAEGYAADLVCGANVMAQVPDLNDFVAGLARLVKPTGTITIEFPHLMTLIDRTEFDTIYHEHYSYFSLIATRTLFARHGLVLTDVDELPTHGGSLRIHARPAAADPPVATAVEALVEREHRAGVDSLRYYQDFADAVQRVRRDLLDWLFSARERGEQVVGYGAPGKGNTLLNHCGIRADLLRYTVDRNPAKQGVLLPGSRIPVHHPDELARTRPDHILILPWNLKDEICQQLAHTAEWGAQLHVPIPRLERVG